MSEDKPLDCKSPAGNMGKVDLSNHDVVKYLMANNWVRTEDSFTVAVMAENKRIEIMRDELICIVADRNLEIAGLRSALEFYARWPESHGHCNGRACTVCDIQIERGETARRALNND